MAGRNISYGLHLQNRLLSIRQNHIAQVCEHVFPECTWYYADSDEVQGGGDVGWGRSPTQKDYLYTYSNMRQSIYTGRTQRAHIFIMQGYRHLFE